MKRLPAGSLTTLVAETCVGGWGACDYRKPRGMRSSLRAGGTGLRLGATAAHCCARAWNGALRLCQWLHTLGPGPDAEAATGTPLGPGHWQAAAIGMGQA
eukprot:3569591-Rhodomonas_salina.1